MTQAISATLIARRAIADHGEFHEGPGGVTVAAVANAQARAVTALQGVQLLNWAPHPRPAGVRRAALSTRMTNNAVPASHSLPLGRQQRRVGSERRAIW